MKKERLIGILIFVVIITVIILFFLFSFNPFAKVKYKERISLIRIEGEIGGDSLSMSSVSPESVKFILNEVKKDGSKGLIIRIDSPGGLVEATEEIYNYIQAFKKDTGLKVYVSMGSTAASGGYYIACAGDKITAMPSTITGSIGVIVELINYEELLSKLGIKIGVIKSGEYKDIGSPAREITEEEKVMFQKIVDTEYEAFLDVVSSSRKIPKDELKNFAKGQIYLGTEDYKIGLVDFVGTLEDAIVSLSKDAGIKGEPEIIEHSIKKGLFSSILSLFNADINLVKGLKPVKIEYKMNF